MTGGGVALRESMRGTAPTTPTDFFDDAACQDADTTVFFPVSDTFAGDAKAICATCPVAEQCLEYAIETHQSDGVWGGLTGRRTPPPGPPPSEGRPRAARPLDRRLTLRRRRPARRDSGGVGLV